MDGIQCAVNAISRKAFMSSNLDFSYKQHCTHFPFSFFISLTIVKRYVEVHKKKKNLYSNNFFL